MPRSVSTVLFHGQTVILAMEYCSAHRPWHLHRIYPNKTHDKHQWLLLQFIVLLKMDAKGVRNMYSIIVVFNKHNTARVASCWFIIYYTIDMLYCCIHQRSDADRTYLRCPVRASTRLRCLEGARDRRWLWSETSKHFHWKSLLTINSKIQERGD